MAIATILHKDRSTCFLCLSIQRVVKILVVDRCGVPSGCVFRPINAGDLVKQTIGMANKHAAALKQVSVAACLTEVEALIRTTWDHANQLDVQAASDLPFVTCDRLTLQNAVLSPLSTRAMQCLMGAPSRYTPRRSHWILGSGSKFASSIVASE
jgi:hypothetical protein